MKRKIKNVTGTVTVAAFLVWVLVTALQSVTELKIGEYTNLGLAVTMMTGALLWVGMELTDNKN